MSEAPQRLSFEQALCLPGEPRGALGATSLLCVALCVRAQARGALSFISTQHDRRYEDADVELARELSRRASAGLDNAELYRTAQVALEQRDDVLAIVSHDLRNPLNAIVLGATAIV
jgi:GAF domain-containing protein